MEDNQITGLVNAVAELKVCCESILMFAEEKQKQRAEPWQQTVIDQLKRGLFKYERYMRGED